MSRIGKKPIEIPAGVNVELNGDVINVSGKLGKLQMNRHPAITVKIESSQVLVDNEKPQDRQAKQMHGTTRALIANMITGVSKGFERKLEIYGTGYNVKEQGNKLIIQVGYSHPAELVIPEGVKVKIDVAATRGNDVPAKFSITSIDKAVIGKFASEIRKIQPPEPYKGKGIRYADEQVRRKVGKAFASGAA